VVSHSTSFRAPFLFWLDERDKQLIKKLKTAEGS